MIKEKFTIKGDINSNLIDGNYNMQQVMFMNNKSYVVGLNFGNDSGAYILESKFSFNK